MSSHPKVCHNCPSSNHADMTPSWSVWLFFLPEASTVLPLEESAMKRHILDSRARGGEEYARTSGLGGIAHKQIRGRGGGR